MDILINELSFSGQAQNPEDANRLMIELKGVIETFTPILGDGKRYVSKNALPNRTLYGNLTVRNWLTKAPSDLKKIALEWLSRSSDIEAHLFDKFPSHSCRFNGYNVSSSTIAGAASLNGILACLNNSLDFAHSSILVEYSSDGETFSQVSVDTISNEQQIWGKYRPHYESSPKHELGGRGTLMDLDKLTAQHVLDQGVAIGRQFYGYYNGKFYEFQNDNFRGFHGYPVREYELPPTAKEKLRRKGVLD